MRIQIAPENQEAEQLLPPAQPDGSRIGINYVDAYIKPMNQAAGGVAVTCKRRGLKITLGIGERSGEALLRRLEDGPDPRQMLRAALADAARSAGAALHIENGIIYLDIPNGNE